MPGDTGEKTEVPTPRRREESRSQGQIARSADLSAGVVLLGAVLLLQFFMPRLLERLGELVRLCLAGAGRVEAGRDTILETGVAAMLTLAGCALPVMLFLALLALVTGLAQAGLLLTGKPLVPQLSRLNPLAGLKRLVSARNLVRAGMSVGKVVIIGGVAYLTIREQLPRITGAVHLDFGQVLILGGQMLFSLGLRLALVLLVLAILDYFWNRYKHEQDLKMTKQEVKEEMRRMEGDPIVKQRRRRVQIQLILQRMGIEVPKSDVVVTNPTEIAIAIRYDEQTMAAPKVVAKGQGYLAERIRQLAVQHGVPIVERPPLARALYRLVEVGQEIPPQFYKAIAEILAYVYELTGRTPRAVATGA